jgi:hypothetical protein
LRRHDSHGEIGEHIIVRGTHKEIIAVIRK